MIPLKISLAGFLKYRDKVEFDFTGQPLWMLYGPNGVGKSSVFDAMTYALFGEHRDGKQNPERLINQQSKGFVVEFDFLIEHSHYRIQRTFTRTGRPTRHISTVSDDKRIDLISGTDMVQQFDEWIRQHLGMDYQAFTACVLLRQGESDRLINADPSGRHKIIGQVIAIQQYEELYKRADQHRKDDAHDAQRLREESALIEIVTEADIEAARIAQESAHSQNARMEAEHEVILRREGEVRQWEKLHTDQMLLTAQVATAAQSLAQAEHIERNFARHQMLERNLPPLRKIVSLRERLAETEASRTQAAQRVQQATSARAVESASYEVVCQRLTQRQAEHTEKGRQERACQQQLMALAPKMPAIQRLAEVRHTLGKITAALSAYPADLAHQLVVCKGAIEQAQNAQMLISPLQQFVRTRDQWQQAQRNLAQVNTMLDALHAQIPDGQSAADYARYTQDNATRSDTELDHLQQRIARLKQLDGKAECELCGQTLTPAHLSAEQERLQSAWHAAQQTQQTHRLRYEAAKNLLQQAQRYQKDQQTAETIIQQQANAARDILFTLPEATRSRIAGTAEGVQVLTQDGYPTGSDVQALQEKCGHLAQLKEQLGILEQDDQAIRSLQSQSIPLREDLARLESDYPSDLVIITLAEEQSTKAQLTILQKAIVELATALADDTRHQQQLAALITKISNDIVAATTAEARYQGTASTQKQELDEAIMACPSDLCAPANVAESALVRWEEEFALLAAAPQQKHTLDADRANQQQREEKLQWIQQEMADLNVLARISLATYEQQVEAIQHQCAAAHQALQAAQTTLQTRRDRQILRQKMDADLRELSQREGCWKRLAQMLDREHLQHYLLRQAEAVIVDFANETLDTISAYTLHLELREDGNQAFDLVAFDTTVGENPIDLRFLSGSQKFRVAFSLAMGIGRYLTTGRQTPEAVIIDEGFGSLDQDGRQQIITEITALAQHLQRIILVSHQDEFAQAFPHAYRIEHDGTTSQARYVVIDDLLIERATREPVE